MSITARISGSAATVCTASSRSRPNCISESASVAYVHRRGSKPCAVAHASNAGHAEGAGGPLLGAATGLFSARTPVRILDTRAGGPLGAATIRDVLGNLAAHYGEDRYRLSPLVARVEP